MTRVGSSTAALLVLQLASSASAQIISPDAGTVPRAWCGPSIRTEAVLVLDIEPFGDVDSAREFIAQHVHDIELAGTTPETISTVRRSTRYDRMSAMKRARREAAERGCDLVLVLQAWEGQNNAAVAFPVPQSPFAFGAGMHHAFARVLLGTAKRGAAPAEPPQVRQRETPTTAALLLQLGLPFGSVGEDPPRSQYASLRVSSAGAESVVTFFLDGNALLGVEIGIAASSDGGSVTVRHPDWEARYQVSAGEYEALREALAASPR